MFTHFSFSPRLKLYLNWFMENLFRGVNRPPKPIINDNNKTNDKHNLSINLDHDKRKEPNLDHNTAKALSFTHVYGIETLFDTSSIDLYINV